MIKVGKPPVIKEIPVPKSPKNGILPEYLEVFSRMITEYHELEKIKEAEETKRLKIKEETELKLKALDTFEKLASDIIEKEFNEREVVLKTIIEKLENTENIEEINLYLRVIVEILNLDFLKKNLEGINLDFLNSNKSEKEGENEKTG